MATAALRAIRHAHPHAHVVGVARPYVREVLAGSAALDELLLVDRLGKSPRALWRTAKELRSRRVTTTILLRRSMPCIALAWLSGAKRRIGYGAGFGAWMLTQNVVPPRGAKSGFAWSTCELYQRIVEAAGCPMASSRLELTVTTADDAAADAVWAQLSLPPPDRVLVLNAGSASPAKVWPEERHAELAARMVATLGCTVLVHCGPKEREQASRIADLSRCAHVKSLSHIHDLPLGLSKAIVRRSRLVVTSCSGVRHLAAAFQTPTVVLSGPVDPASAYSGNLNERTVWLQPECAPCNRSVCPLQHHRCLRDLTVDQVLAAVSRLWDQTATRRAA